MQRQAFRFNLSEGGLSENQYGEELCGAQQNAEWNLLIATLFHCQPLYLFITRELPAGSGSSGKYRYFTNFQNHLN